MTDAILDSGPLIHLAELDALDVLRGLETLRVPDAVWREVQKHQPKAVDNLGARLQRVSVSAPSAELQALALALTLDQGETEALVLMEKYPHAWLLTDDAAARLAAQERGYVVHGTLGLLIRSVRREERTPQQVLELLRSIPKHSSLFVRPSLLDKIIQGAEREWLKKHRE